MESESKSAVLYENLDTSFVNLWALLRFLSQRSFVGRVRVELKDYTADVFLTGSNTPLVHEVDRTAGTDRLEEAALHRLVLRARESPGSISVFEGAEEAVSVSSVAPEAKPQAGPPASPADGLSAESMNRTPTLPEPPLAVAPPSTSPSSLSRDALADASAASEKWDDRQSESTPVADWSELLRAGGELIGGVERALNGVGADFATLFRAARLELADDYTFLDPLSGRFEYANSVVTSADEFSPDILVAGLSQALRRSIDEVATGVTARRVRERVALELALAARKRGAALPRSGFHSQLDRIAGTKVI